MVPMDDCVNAHTQCQIVQFPKAILVRAGSLMRNKDVSVLRRKLLDVFPPNRTSAFSGDPLTPSLLLAEGASERFAGFKLRFATAIVRVPDGGLKTATQPSQSYAADIHDATV